MTETKRASSAPPSFLGGPSFLGTVFGRGEPSGVQTSGVPPSGPGTGSPLAAAPQWGYAPEQGSATPLVLGGGLMGDGGFLRSAAITAAGIAGGTLLFEGIQSMFGHHDTAGITGNQVVMPGLGETVLNKDYGAETDAAGGGFTEEDAGVGYDPNLAGSGPAADSGQDLNRNNAS